MPDSASREVTLRVPNRLYQRLTMARGLPLTGTRPMRVSVFLVELEDGTHDLRFHVR